MRKRPLFGDLLDLEGNQEWSHHANLDHLYHRPHGRPLWPPMTLRQRTAFLHHQLPMGLLYLIHRRLVGPTLNLHRQKMSMGRGRPNLKHFNRIFKTRWKYANTLCSDLERRHES